MQSLKSKLPASKYYALLELQDSVQDLKIALRISKGILDKEEDQKYFEEYLTKKRNTIPAYFKREGEMTKELLEQLYVSWSQIPHPNYERFGQYVFNQTNYEYENSYNIKDGSEAYTLLLKSITK